MSPKTIGHKTALKHLFSVIERDRTPHAFLLTGPRAVGKRVAAMDAARLLLSTDTPENHPDFHLVEKPDGKKDIPVELIRELSKNLSLKSFSGGASVAIIDEAERLSGAAANALLKTLEEPRDGTHIFLVTQSETRIPETIASRAQKFIFGFLSEDEVREILAGLTENQLKPEVLDFLKKASAGSLAKFGLGPEIAERVESLEKFASTRKTLRSELTGLFKKDPAYALSLAASYTKDKTSPRDFWEELKLVTKEQYKSPGISKYKLSLFFEELLEAEHLVKERNLNETLKLSEVFVKASGLQV